MKSGLSRYWHCHIDGSYTKLWMGRDTGYSGYYYGYMDCNEDGLFSLFFANFSCLLATSTTLVGGHE